MHARRPVASLVLLAAALVGPAACGGDQQSGTTTAAPSTTPPSTTTPAAAGDGPQVADLDLCENPGEAPAEAFLSALGQGPVDQSQGRSTDEAAVCGWFLAPVGDARPEGVLVRVEPAVSTGNDLCAAPDGGAAGTIEVDGEPGWVAEREGRIEAAVTTGAWCVYLRGPAGVAPGADVATTASSALLGEVAADLPSPG